MEFGLADIEDFNEIQKLYWNLINKSSNEPSFPGWKCGEHPSDDFIMASIVQKEMYVIRVHITGSCVVRIYGIEE